MMQRKVIVTRHTHTHARLFYRLVDGRQRRRLEPVELHDLVGDAQHDDGDALGQRLGEGQLELHRAGPARVGVDVVALIRREIEGQEEGNRPR